MYVWLFACARTRVPLAYRLRSDRTMFGVSLLSTGSGPVARETGAETDADRVAVAVSDTPFSSSLCDVTLSSKRLTLSSSSLDRTSEICKRDESESKRKGRKIFPTRQGAPCHFPPTIRLLSTHITFACAKLINFVQAPNSRSRSPCGSNVFGRTRSMILTGKVNIRYTRVTGTELVQFISMLTHFEPRTPIDLIRFDPLA